VDIKGSDVWTPSWQLAGGTVYSGVPADAVFNDDVYVEDKNPFKVDHWSGNGRHCGMVFVDGQMYRESQDTPGAERFRVDNSTGAIHICFPDNDPASHTVEITTRRRIFSPHVRGLAYVTVRGFTMEHAGNQSSLWVASAFTEVLGREMCAALDAQGGHHWTIENCEVNYSVGTGIDIGGYSDTKDWERNPAGSYDAHHNIVRNCIVNWHGQQGINTSLESGSPGYNEVVGNYIAEANWMDLNGYEEAAIKSHYLKNSLIADNVVVNMHGHGQMGAIWLDWYSDQNNRITRNFVHIPGGFTALYYEVSINGTNLADNNVFIGNINYNNHEYSTDIGGNTNVHNLVEGWITNTGDSRNNLHAGHDGVALSYDGTPGKITLTVTAASIPEVPLGDSRITEDYFGNSYSAPHIPGPFQDLTVGTTDIYCWPKTPATPGAPVARVQASPTSGMAPLDVSFDGSSSTDDDGSIVSYEWDFDDGITGTGAAVSHTYADRGVYSARLTVTDNEGKTGTATRTITVIDLRQPDNVPEPVAGLQYSYYEGSWTVLPDFGSLTPAATGVVSSFDISVAQQSDNYGLRFTGYVDVPADGIYTFYLNSDDGSRLYIGADVVVDNDGEHAPTEQSGIVPLQAGMHAITVDFFEATGGEGLTVSWEGPGLSKQEVPASALYNGDPSTLRSTMASGVLAAPVWLSRTPSGLTVICSRSGDYRVELMSVSGRTLAARQVTGPAAIELAHTPAGTYVVRMEHGGVVTTERVTFTR
jgi:PKD repeat protein